MHVLESIQEWRQVRKSIQGTVGLVPTMGALHEGHLSLVQQSSLDNDVTVLSIFVNPTQFNETDDLVNYPRALKQDLALLEGLDVDYVLLPHYQEMYPDDYRYSMTESLISHELEGTQRPGHFNGMLTVVLKLLNLARPQKAYFGEKDYQQLILVRDMVNAFFLDVEIVGCSTVREEDGLAMASRNQRLSSEQRARAYRFSEVLASDKSCEEMTTDLEEAGFVVEYVAKRYGRVLGAVQIDNVRLIDNVACEHTV